MGPSIGMLWRLSKRLLLRLPKWQLLLQPPPLLPRPPNKTVQKTTLRKTKVRAKKTKASAKAKKNRKRRNKNTNKKKGNFKKSPFTEIDVPSMQADNASLELPRFGVSVKCGGGAYIRSLVRDIGYELDTVATMTGLVRTKQGPFVLEDALRREDWNADMIYEAIRKGKEKTQQIDESKD
mmetsp:Transcript_5599/g.10858  ORF Transcript_5599/g.10858 Transcript_5599/m.10858 type:complete len:180 (+) Transcript_5599:896-1435(+)